MGPALMRTIGGAPQYCSSDRPALSLCPGWEEYIDFSGIRHKLSGNQLIKARKESIMTTRWMEDSWVKDQGDTATDKYELSMRRILNAFTSHRQTRTRTLHAVSRTNICIRRHIFAHIPAFIKSIHKHVCTNRSIQNHPSLLCAS